MADEHHAEAVHNKKSKKKVRARLVAEAEKRMKDMIEIEQSPNWVFKKRAKGIDIYTMKPPEGCSLDFFKGVGVVNCTVTEMQKFLRSGVSLIREVDKMYSYGSMLGDIVPDQMTVAHTCYKAPGRPLVSDRDFTYINFYRPDLGAGVSFDSEYHAEDLDKLGISRPEPKSGVVRGFLLGGGYFYRPFEGRSDQIQLVYIAQADIKGWIPAWVANMTAADQALNVHSIAKYFERLHGKASGEEPQEPVAAELNGEHPGAVVQADDGKKTKHKKKSKKSKKKNGGDTTAAAAPAVAPAAAAAHSDDDDSDEESV